MVLSRDRHIDQWGKKQGTQKQTYASMPEWFLTKMQKEFNGRKIVSQQMVQKQSDINGQKINKPDLSPTPVHKLVQSESSI